jgi:succinoglycan biosynthesis protein ExoA
MNLPVTIILPTLNEKEYIEACLDSLSSQDYASISEILVVDGGSSDGTQNLVRARNSKIRLIHNPKMTAAAAMNLGIENCSTDVFVRVDAHTEYAKDYVSKSVETFLKQNAQVVGGLMRPTGTTSFGRAVAAVTSSPFGVGPGKFHYSEKLQEVDTVYLGIFDKKFVLDVGGYDEDSLQWAAEDQELNFRIRRAGGKIILDPSIHSTYFPRDNPRALGRQYHNYGMCKASTLAKHKTLPYWRPLVPAMMVLITVLWCVGAVFLQNPLWAFLPFLVYLVPVVGLSTRMAKNSETSSLRIASAFAICHWTYGAGFWRGVIRFVSFRKFDSKPKKGRR